MPLDVLREALRMSVVRTSLRKTAEAVDLSPRGLDLFIKGSKPREATLKKLHDWYVIHAPVVLGSSRDVAALSLANLLEGLDAARRESVAEAILILIDGYHRKQGSKPPAWLAALQRGAG